MRHVLLWSLVCLGLGAALLCCPGDEEPRVARWLAVAALTSQGGETVTPLDVTDSVGDISAAAAPPTGAERALPRGFELPFDENIHCLDSETGKQGWCAKVGDGGAPICTLACIEECPDGYGCIAIANVGSDGLQPASSRSRSCSGATATNDATISAPALWFGVPPMSPAASIQLTD